MKKIFKLIFRIILVFIFISVVSMVIDYIKVNNNSLPIFNRREYNSKTSIESFKGIIYTFKRKVKSSVNESLNESSNLSFKVLSINLDVKEKDISESKNYIITYDSSECDKSTLYYADYDIKIYTYCIDNIKLNGKSLKDNSKEIINLEKSMLYKGTYKNSYWYSLDNISLYHCKNKDYYIGNNDMEYMDDFCTDKDDDFKYLAKVKEELPQGVVIEAKDEVFYEDENYKYQFNQLKSQYVFIVVDEVRGKSAKRYTLKEVLNNKLLTIDELEEKGLVFEKVSK